MVLSWLSQAWRKILFIIFVCGLVALTGCEQAERAEKSKPEVITPNSPVTAEVSAQTFQLPIESYQLDNGLTVILSTDHSAPVVSVGVFYQNGYRTEAKNRTGYSHLLEHLMFQGTSNLAAGEYQTLIRQTGGFAYGETQLDNSQFVQSVPAHSLETVLWAEADRMQGLSFDAQSLEKQKAVIKAEVNHRLNQSNYGGFPWLTMPQLAFDNWHNNHDFYGDLRDIETATVEHVSAFYQRHYQPQNAILVIVGDFNLLAAKAMIKQHFSQIFSNIDEQMLAQNEKRIADISEPKQLTEKLATHYALLAPNPALALAYQMPARGTVGFYSMLVIDQLLLQGHDSQLYQALTTQHNYKGQLTGGVNFLLGNSFSNNNPMLWTISLTYPASLTAEDVRQIIEQKIAQLRNNMISKQQLKQAINKVKAQLFDLLDYEYGIGRASLLASLEMFDGGAAELNKIEGYLGQLTPELIKQTAEQYLTINNRSTIILTPGDAPKAETAND